MKKTYKQSSHTAEKKTTNKSPGPSKLLLKEILEQSGIRLSQDAIGKLWVYHNYLKERNEELNLTRLHSFQTVVRKHYIDSLLPLNILKTHNIEIPQPLLDMGSGAGFPGVPIAIARPELKVILNDGRKVRADFLSEVIRIAKIENAVSLAKKISPGFTYTEEVRSVITRAVDPMDESIIRASDVLSPGGLFIFLKGPNCDAEIEAVKNLPGEPCRLLLDEHYVLPDSEDERRLVVWKYISRTDLSSVRFSGSTRTSAEFHGTAAFSKIKEMENAVYIESENNSFFKLLKSLNNSRNIRKNGIAIVSGKKIIKDFLSNYKNNQIHGPVTAAVPDTLIFDEKSPSSASDFSFVLSDIKKAVLKSSLFREADFLGTGSPILTVTIPEIPDWNGEFIKGMNLFLPFSDPDNLGAAIRTAAVFGASQIILLSESAYPFHPKAVRSSAGAVFSVKLANGPPLEDLNKFINFDKHLLLILDGKADMTLSDLITSSEFSVIRNNSNSGRRDSIALPDSFGILAGLEGKGLPENISGRRIRIEGDPSVESLNASVALGIMLYNIYIYYLKRTATE